MTAGTEPAEYCRRIVTMPPAFSLFFLLLTDRLTSTPAETYRHAHTPGSLVARYRNARIEKYPVASVVIHTRCHRILTPVVADAD